ncbi:GH25 family lysozyme [Mesorhizobium sp.]|uniref:glycoside hydrolase family 25 protein n=1 Tax=Mesorhizobium sp. TaxID=1871066 RepID=UPI000FE6F0D7|nr:GH25 family lysozyme [Mesorhizobium sp.]RWO82724.1 MAG: muramidase [Mesorhizobium sp.]RWQ49596.1 MAG: muramidase [Mesorhizobium sp.]
MRLSGVVIFSIASLCLAGCTSTSGVDALQVPSSETTSSVVRPPAPVASVGAADAEPDFAPEEATEQTVAMATPEPMESIEPPAEPIALVAPTRLARAAPMLAEPVQRYRFRDAKPINFGRASPRHLAVHGVDVSRWQGNVNWAKLRAQGANFAYIKATDGGDHLDPMFRKNWRNADAAGLKRGAYHFFYWCRTAGEQADWFIRNVPRVEGALPPVIDVEWNGESSCKRRPSRQKVLEKMQVFMDKLERHYGQRPIIYTAPDFYRDNLRGAFLDYPFWLRAVAQHPSKVYPGRKWVFWQYSGSGLSHGVRGRIDLNVFHGDERAWRNWAGGRQMVAEAE